MAKMIVMGCGRMGSALIGAFLDQGHEVRVVNRSEAPARPFVERGACYFRELRDAADQDFVLLNLPNAEITGEILSNLGNKMKDAVFINSCTATISEVARLSQLVTEGGGKYLDCKLECYPQEIGTRRAFIVCSGDRSIFESNYDALKALSDTPKFLGETVTAAAAVDMGPFLDVFYALHGSMLEGCCLAMKNHVSLETCFEALTAWLPGVIDGMKRQFANAFRTGISRDYPLAKDSAIHVHYSAMESVVASMKESGMKPSIGAYLLELLSDCQKRGDGDKEITAMMKLLVDP